MSEDYKPGMCEQCPNRHLADLFEQLGSQDKAAAIRASGCSWWWGVPEEDEETGQSRTRYMCGAAALPGYLRRYGHDVVRAVDCIQDDREERQRALAAVQNACDVHGLEAVVGALAKLGLDAHLGQRLLRGGD